MQFFLGKFLHDVHIVKIKAWNICYSEEKEKNKVNKTPEYKLNLEIMPDTEV